jgi:hypothetical protein
MFERVRVRMPEKKIFLYSGWSYDFSHRAEVEHIRQVWFSICTFFYLFHHIPVTLLGHYPIGLFGI